ncbi:MAG: phosphatase PAP2 family protein [Alphaproteobacteria bacterium]|nr:phosphatase PAP2 family protein [Alphaproteobacteria bacterium]
MNAAWKNALRCHRPLLAAVAVYAAAVFSEALYAGAGAQDLAAVARYFVLSATAMAIFIVGMYAGAGAAFLLTAPKGQALNYLDDTAKKYVSSERFAGACLGFVILASGNVFLVSKSLIAVLNPYSWDIDFSAWDRLLHFGTFPHQYIIPAVNRLDLGWLLDRAYYGWLIVMTVVAWFCIFADRQLHRRLRFLWVYFLSWALLGTVAATVFSSVGPVFFSAFIKSAGNPYEFVTVNMQALHRQSPLLADTARRLLLRWHDNNTLVDPNAISAMPSMHIAMCWLFVLYARSFGKAPFAAALAFCAVIFAGAIYFGFHYAIDGYVSIAAVSLLWWVMGKYIDRHHREPEAGA